MEALKEQYNRIKSLLKHWRDLKRAGYDSLICKEKINTLNKRLSKIEQQIKYGQSI